MGLTIFLSGKYSFYYAVGKKKNIFSDKLKYDFKTSQWKSSALYFSLTKSNNFETGVVGVISGLESICHFYGTSPYLKVLSVFH